MTTFTPDPKVWGQYNDPPPGFRPAEANDFWHHFGIYGTGDKQFFRQFVIPGDSRMSSVHLFLHDDNTGWAVTVEGGWKIDQTSEGPKGYSASWPRFFKFGLCEHDWQHEAVIGRCCNRYRCSKCKMTKDVDSSD